MKKFAKKLTALTLSALLVVACADTASINQQSEQTYRQTINQVRAKGALDNSSTTAKRIKNVFNHMVPYAKKENKTGVPFNWEINVVKSNDLNAWAMPGGKMVFYTGIVDRLKLSDDEIAVVMGHEMAHALQEHGKAQHNVGIFTNLGVALGKIAMQSAGIAGGELLDTGATLAISNPYSRSHETEADEVGLFLMAKAGYNPSAAPVLWQKMRAAGGGSVPTLLSTHPSNEDRQENLQALLPEAMKIYQAKR